ncbi:hypothetical protein PA598K_04117 [Paenibacillus sp. 598K]|uniref:MBL fold metallo-hydrolase n=1 Tax=Paenibacillus sp. 598K TaxID=1117987 RepID=UPI000FFAD7C1|nr:MBL fold metallo-hydrolase [Paenibacillus sp. 598K]GBF75695.1 hypothetical protein PA598K_04117 [Paenibacillus sp. 598K]
MSALYEQLHSVTPPVGAIAVWSLGQAGYAYKLPCRRVVLIDPYVTDYAEQVLGQDFKRLTPSIIAPAELARLPIAAYLLTHHHEDHLDADCIRAMQSASFPFYAPPTALDKLAELGVAEHRCHALRPGDVHELEGWTIAAACADHGELAPDAVGIIVRAQGKTIYHMGDTCDLGETFRESCGGTPVDLLIAPINGRYGNMDTMEAAEAVRLIAPSLAAPCHFWMLPGNSGGDPLLFAERVRQLSPSTVPFVFRLGELLIV